MDTQFTPGPWRYAKCQCGHPSCDQHTISTQGGVGFEEADARLIAAAPDLYEALSELLSGHDNLYVAHWGPNADPHNDIASKAARAALAKARGEA